MLEKCHIVQKCHIGDKEQCHIVCKVFFEAARITHSEMLQKPKVHLLLHMEDFGPTSAYNTERYTIMCEWSIVLTLTNMYICPILQTDVNPSIHFYILSMFLGIDSHQAVFCCSRAYTLSWRWWNTRWWTQVCCDCSVAADINDPWFTQCTAQEWTWLSGAVILQHQFSTFLTTFLWRSFMQTKWSINLVL